MRVCVVGGVSVCDRVCEGRISQIKVDKQKKSLTVILNIKFHRQVIQVSGSSSCKSENQEAKGRAEYAPGCKVTRIASSEYMDFQISGHNFSRLTEDKQQT